MYRSILFRVIAGLVLLAAIAGIAYFAYTAGVSQGQAINLVNSGSLPQGAERFAYGFPFYPMMGFGAFGVFGFLRCLIPLFLFFLIFSIFRHLMWGGRRMMHGYGHWNREGGVPPMFDEWHRRAHEKPAEPTSEPPSGQGS